MPTIAVTDTTFQKDILESELPVLVDFWANWCEPCKKIAPTLEKLADEFRGRLTVAKVDIDTNPRVPQALRIQSIPTMLMFSGGRPVDVIQGALPEEQLRRFVEPHLAPPPVAEGSISVELLAASIQGGQPITIVDVRAPVDFGRSHLRRAINIPADQWPGGLATLNAPGPIVVVCRTGDTSRELVEAHGEEFSSPLMALEKGLLEWEGDGHPTYSNREEASLDEV
ncbi:MAG: thioredoxin [Myxococcales bacterium]|nr:thioredoxin [Myxococcales bacterium]